MVEKVQTAESDLHASVGTNLASRLLCLRSGEMRAAKSRSEEAKMCVCSLFSRCEYASLAYINTENSFNDHVNVISL